MQSEVLFREIKQFTGRASNNVQQFTPRTLLEVQNLLRTHLTSPDIISQLEFDPYFHFNISLSVDPALRKVRVNIVPLTVIGLEMLMSSGIHIDESLQKQIRKIQDQRITHEIIYSGQREADIAQRSLRDNARTEQEPVQQRRVEEQSMETQDRGSDILSVADSGHTPLSGSGVMGTKDSDSVSEGLTRDRIDDSVLHSTEGAKSSGSVKVQGS